MCENKPKYILCPRCELNYINESDGYCKVCQAELGLADPSILIPDEEELSGEKLCPICKVNYIAEDEEICFLCKREKETKESPEENDDAWRDFVDDEVPDDSKEMSEISLSELADEEEEEDEDEESDEALPDDFDYDVDADDFADVEDDEDEDEEEDDEDSDF